MKIFLIIVLNAGLVALFFKLGKKKNLLSFLDGGKWWLTWLSIAIITLMDELTSIFYVPAESYLLVGVAAFVFIIATSIFIRFLSSRMVEIAHILEHHGIRGGGVYSFSYLVLGPTMSFAAVASILVDYILTAAISTVSAVYNGSSLFSISPVVIYVLFFAAIWAVALLNIVGIRENARFTFYVFVAAAMILLTLVLSAVIDPSPGQIARATNGFHLTWTGITGNSLFGGVNFFIFGFAGVILAYSGIESVIQTAGLVKSWKEIRKAYIFLAVTVGIVTPLITMLVLTRTDINFGAHEDDLITYFARVVNGPFFAYLVGGLASFTLIMAVNTAFVASSELLERVAHRYGFAWLIKTNKADSLYRIHIMNATLFSVVIAITAGSQEMLAHMYAVGLVASFTINMGALVYYRYSEGSEEIPDYHTSRTGTFIIFLLLLAVFSFIAYHKWQGFLLWAVTVTIFQIIGFRVAK
ncbi:MAG TPA: amino acid permease, partial [Candidatus Kapabacteria bacterium]|nr:amino acid permease [Candidatus Kapabacteria bacterium]